MATVPTCTVPMNFGRHYLEFNGLNDLQLMCSGDEVVRTSSFPLAMNSLVICDLVGKQQMKELDVEEFSLTSVSSFVDFCYTGTVDLTKEIFREINKLSAVFKIEWMAKECLKFYTDLCSGLTSGSLELVWFLFVEAAYILKERNNKDFKDALNTKLGKLSSLRLALVNDFLCRDPNQQEYINTDLCLSLASVDEGTVLYEWFIENFEGKSYPVKLSDVEKRFLTVPSLTLCLQASQALYLRLLETLELRLSKEDQASLFTTFAKLAVSGPHNSPSCLNVENKIVYPIVIPALGECTSFLESVKVLDEEPRIKSWLQFVSSLVYCCEEFGDTDSSEPDVAIAIAGALEKRKYWDSSTLQDYFFVYFRYFDQYPEVKGILEKYIMNKKKGTSISLGSTCFEMDEFVLPLKYSKRVFLDLHEGDSYCDENTRESNKRCKVALDVSISVEDVRSWPIFTIKLIEDRAILEAETDAHFHQNADFLQNLFIDCYGHDNFTVFDYTYNYLTVCSDLNDTTTSAIEAFYESWKRGIGNSVCFCLNWPHLGEEINE